MPPGKTKDEGKEYPFDIICTIYDEDNEILGEFMAFYKIHKLYDRYFKIDSGDDTTMGENRKQMAEHVKACDWSCKTYNQFLEYQRLGEYDKEVEEIFYKDTDQRTIKVEFSFIKNEDCKDEVKE
jgi:hypothetical protein